MKKTLFLTRQYFLFSCTILDPLNVRDRDQLYFEISNQLEGLWGGSHYITVVGLSDADNARTPIQNLDDFGNCKYYGGHCISFYMEAGYIPGNTFYIDFVICI